MSSAAAPLVLRSYQERLIDGARDHIRAGRRRILLQSPCGSGKTVLAAFMTRNSVERGHPVMFLTHREELAKQAAKTYVRVGVRHGMIMARRTPDFTALTQVAMIDTLRNRLDKLLAPPRIVIVDEAHHSVSPSWARVIAELERRGAIIIGLSATPERLDGRGLADIFEVLVPGPSVRELIDAGSLVDYTYYAPPSQADLSGVHMQYGDYNVAELEAAVDQPKIIGDAVEHYLRLIPGRRAIAFAVSIKHSKHVADQFNAAGVPAAHVDGETPADQREAAIRDFAEGRLRLLSNVALFGEGFDVPACDGVILLRATASKALHIQMAGRAMRPSEGKERAVIIDHVGNVKRHGLPDEEHVWTLEGRPKRAKRGKDEDEIKVQQCPKCYFCHEPAPACPNCGHVYTAAERGELEQVEGQLEEITPEMREAIHRAKLREQGKAQTVEELMALGKSKWEAEKILAARAAKQALISALTADLVAWQQQTGEAPQPTFGVSLRELRSMAPKALKALRAAFEAHRVTHATAPNGVETTSSTGMQEPLPI